MMKRLALCAPLLVLGLSTSAWASPLLQNGIFERAAAATPSSTDGVLYMSAAVNGAAIPGWQITSGTIDLVPGSYWETPNGTNFCVDLIGTPGSEVGYPGLGQISQEVPTEAGKTYQLTFEMSVNPTTGTLREYSTLKRMLVEAIAVGEEGETVLASREYSLARGTRHPQDMQWLTDVQVDGQHRTFTFTATGNTILRFTAEMPLYAPSGATATTVYCGPALGNVGLTLLGGGGEVPEPASLGLLGVGVSALLLRRRRGR